MIRWLRRISLCATATTIAVCLAPTANAVPLVVRGWAQVTMTGGITTSEQSMIVSPVMHAANQSDRNGSTLLNPRLGRLRERNVAVQSIASRSFFGAGPFVHYNNHESGATTGVLASGSHFPIAVSSVVTQRPYRDDRGVNWSEVTFHLTFRLNLSSFGLPSVEPASDIYSDVFAFPCESVPCPIQGSWSLILTINSEMEYEPKSVDEYIAEALAANGNDAYRAFKEIIELREWDATTSSENLALRNAEYWLRGYWAATAVGEYPEESIWDRLSRGNEHAAMWYNLIKEFQSPDASKLPPTPPGGTLYFLDGYWAGRAGRSAQEGLRNLLSNGAAFPRGTGMAPTAPLRPQSIGNAVDEIGSFPVTSTNLEVEDASRLYYVDPEGGKTALWSALDNRIVGLQIPILSEQPSMSFTLRYGTATTVLHSNAYFDFLRDAPNGIRSFSLSSDEPAFRNATDFVIGLKFADPGATTVVAASLPDAVAVEYHHSAFDHYFVTALPAEVVALDSGAIAGWSRTGHAFGVLPISAPGTSPVCRFFGASFAPRSSHFYTSVDSECESVKRNSLWTYEGRVFGVLEAGAAGSCPIGARPLYRLYNDGKNGAPNHRYTTQEAVRSAMLTQGWIPEGLGAAGVIACVPN